jgi:hypothetical protein
LSKMRSSMAQPSVCFGVLSRRLSNVIGLVTENVLSRVITLSHWSRLHLQSLAPTNPHWARVVGYGPFSLCVIQKEGLCPNSGDINRLMMMMIMSNINIDWQPNMPVTLMTINILQTCLSRTLDNN